MRNKLRTGTLLRRTVATALAVSALGLSANALADEAKERELEARVAELEAMVRQLAAQQQAGVPATAAPAPDNPIQPTTITPKALPNTTFMVTGFVKADALWTGTPDGVIDGSSAGRDFYIPSTIPVNGEDEDVVFDAHMKQSRFQFGTDTLLDSGDKISSRFEVDFYGSITGNERISNTYAPVLRHAYVTYKNWLVGQTWSNVMNVSSLPEAVDFIGTTDGTTFVRQPQLRYTAGGFSVSVENPETTVTDYETGARIEADDSSIPDFTARYTLGGDWGNFVIAGLLRELKYTTTGENKIDDSKWTGFISLSGKWNIFSRDDIRWMLNFGNIGRYGGLNFSNEAAVNAKGELESIDGVQGFIAWRHVWTDKFRNTLYYAAQDYDNPGFLSDSVNKSSQSIGLDVFYSPVPKLDVGVGYRYAKRELEGGDDGTMNRVQFTTKYSF